MVLRGLSYPLSHDNGDLVITDNYVELVRQAIVHSIQTIKGELVWTPGYGRDWLVFDSSFDTARILAKLRASIAKGLEGYSGVSFSLLGGWTSEGELTVVVNYFTPDSDPSTTTVVLDLSASR